MGVQDVVSANPGFTNIVTNVPHHSVDEVVYGDGRSVREWSKADDGT